jgi:nucleotide-binding universal stress UspA family protein
MDMTLCAVDLGSMTTRVVVHAAGFAGAMGSELKIVHATDAAPAQHNAIVDAFFKALPYDVSISESSFTVRTGKATDVILDDAAARGAEVIVMGSSSHGGLARMLLGSTSDAVLQQTKTSVLLVPPTSMDIVTAGPRPAVTCGAVLAAIDLADVNHRQLALASRIAAVASCPLHLVTIAGAGISDHDAGQELRALAHHIGPVRPRGLIVRRGDVAEEVSRCAASEKAGLVVMGLRDRARGRPGRITAKVLHSHRAFVLAVPADDAH